MSDIVSSQFEYHRLIFLHRDVVRLICESLGHDVDRAWRFRSRGEAQEGQATYDLQGQRMLFL
jgi:hypothetical protein